MTNAVSQPILSALRDAYDRLGLLVLTNSLWLLCALATTAGWTVTVKPPGLQLVAVVISAIVVAGPLTYGLYALWAAVVRREHDTPALLLSGFGRAFPRAVGFFALNVLICVASAYTVVFWLSTTVVALKLIGLVWAWLLLIWLMAQGYALPLLVTQDLTVIGTERLALYLVFRYLPASLVLAAQTLALIALLSFPVILSSPMLMGVSVLLVGLLFFSYTCVLHCHVTFWLIRRELAGTSPLAPEPNSGTESEE